MTFYKIFFFFLLLLNFGNSYLLLRYPCENGEKVVVEYNVCTSVNNRYVKIQHDNILVYFTTLTTCENGQSGVILDYALNDCMYNTELSTSILVYTLDACINYPTTWSAWTSSVNIGTSNNIATCMVAGTYPCKECSLYGKNITRYRNILHDNLSPCWNSQRLCVLNSTVFQNMSVYATSIYISNIIVTMYNQNFDDSSWTLYLTNDIPIKLADFNIKYNNINVYGADPFNPTTIVSSYNNNLPIGVSSLKVNCAAFYITSTNINIAYMYFIAADNCVSNYGNISNGITPLLYFHTAAILETGGSAFTLSNCEFYNYSMALFSIGNTNTNILFTAIAMYYPPVTLFKYPLLATVINPMSNISCAFIDNLYFVLSSYNSTGNCIVQSINALLGVEYTKVISSLSDCTRSIEDTRIDGEPIIVVVYIGAAVLCLLLIITCAVSGHIHKNKKEE